MQAVYLRTAGLRPPPTHPRAFQLSKEHVKYHPASKNRTHMEPLRTRDKDIVFANREGLCPSQPNAFFLCRAGRFLEHRTINKNCFKRIVVIDFVKSIMQAVFLCMGGGLRSPNPRAFQSVQEGFKYHPASNNRAYMDPLRTRDKDVVFANGGGLCPPPFPPLSFYAVQARTSCHQQELLHAHNCCRPFQIPSCAQSICKRGARAFLSCARTLQVSSCQQKQNPYGASLRTRDKDIVFANGGGAAPPPPNPPRTSHH